MAEALAHRGGHVSGTFHDLKSHLTAQAYLVLADLSTKISLPEAQQPMLHGFAEAVEDYNAAPQDPQILLSAGDTPSTVPVDLAIHESWFNEPSLGKALELAKVKATELDLKQVASDIGIWLEHHPWKAAFYAASAIGFFAPEILSLPALEALGFGLAGVRADGGLAGSLAAKIQSVIGDVAARSVFAIWQSARVGRYGVEYVNGGVRALVALADAAVAACNPLEDCKGLMSDAGQPSPGIASAKTALAVVCGCLVGSNMLSG
ncbi:MAG: hypothetical protein Q9208_008380 [Pyrenodesmia sp. 3 TL-2023]